MHTTGKKHCQKTNFLLTRHLKGAGPNTISLCRNLQWGGAQLTDQRAYITTDNIHKPRARAITTQ